MLPQGQGLSSESATEEGEKIQTQIDLQGLDCASCVLRIENQLKRVKGIDDARVSYLMNRLYVTFDPSKINRSGIEAAIEKLGYRLRYKRYESLTRRILSKLRTLQLV